MVVTVQIDVKDESKERISGIDVTNGHDNDDDGRASFETHSDTVNVFVLTDRMTDLCSISADWLVDYYRLQICSSAPVK